MTFTYFDKAEKYSPLSEEAVPCNLWRNEKVCFEAGSAMVLIRLIISVRSAWLEGN